MTCIASNTESVKNTVNCIPKCMLTCKIRALFSLAEVIYTIKGQNIQVSLEQNVLLKSSRAIQ